MQYLLSDEVFRAKERGNYYLGIRVSVLHTEKGQEGHCIRQRGLVGRPRIRTPGKPSLATHELDPHPVLG